MTTLPFLLPLHTRQKMLYVIEMEFFTLKKWKLFYKYDLKVNIPFHSESLPGNSSCLFFFQYMYFLFIFTLHRKKDKKGEGWEWGHQPRTENALHHLCNLVFIICKHFSNPSTPQDLQTFKR